MLIIDNVYTGYQPGSYLLENINFGYINLWPSSDVTSYIRYRPQTKMAQSSIFYQIAWTTVHENMIYIVIPLYSSIPFYIY